MKPNCKHSNALLLAFRKGYRVNTDGTVESASGKNRNLQKCGTKRRLYYYKFNISLPDGSKYPIKVHQLAAYQKYKSLIMDESIVVRHLDGNSLNNSLLNIAIGSHSENSMDRPKQHRVNHATKASFSNIRKDWGKIDADRKLGMSYRSLEKKYNVSKGTLSYHFNKK